MSENDRNRSWRRSRFSLAALLLFTTACALVLAAGKWLLYEPPTHKIPLYEKAPGTRTGSMEIGPNRIGIRLVARNDRDGSIHYEDGHGAALQNVTAKNAQALVNAAGWLDVVQIELEPTPDRVDVIDIRIFDHKTRARITDIDPGFGWRLLEPDVLQIYGLEKLIPQEVDVWLRLHSYSASDTVVTLAAQPQTTCELPIGAITIDDIRAGRWNWSSTTGFGDRSGTDNDVTAVVLTLDRTRPVEVRDAKYQVAAVSTSGEKAFESVPHIIPLWAPRLSGRLLLTFDIRPEDLSHFEIRPFGGRHRFFFDAVKLPAASAPFGPPPIVKIPVAGQEIDVQVPEFAPLEVSIATHRGHWVGGVATNERRTVMLPHPNVTGLDREFVVVQSVRGIGEPLRCRILMSPNATLGSTSSNGGQRAGGGPFSATFQTYRSPLEDAAELEVSFQLP